MTRADTVLENTKEYLDNAVVSLSEIVVDRCCLRGEL